MCSEPSATRRSRKLGVGEHALDHLAERMRVASAKAQPDLTMRDDFAQAARVGDDAGAIGGHRLQRHKPERLVKRRDHAGVGDPVERVQNVVTDPAEEGAVVHQPELRSLLFQLLLVGAGSGDQKARPGDGVDQPRHRFERKLKALLVDEPADQQDELLLGGRKLRAQPSQLDLVLGLKILGVDAVGDDRDPLLVDAEDVDDLLAHVVRAGDDAI